MCLHLAPAVRRCSSRKPHPGASPSWARRERPVWCEAMRPYRSAVGVSARAGVWWIRFCLIELTMPLFRQQEALTCPHKLGSAWTCTPHHGVGQIAPANSLHSSLAIQLRSSSNRGTPAGLEPASLAVGSKVAHGFACLQGNHGPMSERLEAGAREGLPDATPRRGAP